MSQTNTIVAIRMHYSLQQIDVARICKVSRWQVVQWEAGRSSPTLQQLQLLAEELDTTIVKLMSLQYDGIKHRIRL